MVVSEVAVFALLGVVFGPPLALWPDEFTWMTRMGYSWYSVSEDPDPAPWRVVVTRGLGIAWSFAGAGGALFLFL